MQNLLVLGSMFRKHIFKVNLIGDFEAIRFVHLVNLIIIGAEDLKIHGSRFYALALPSHAE